jgi:uncharacterized protein YjbJ (UPF0337 family)
MRNDLLRSQWQRLRVLIQDMWSEITDDDLARVQGNWDLLVDRIQARTGDLRANIENRLEDLLDSLETSDHRRPATE